MQQKNLALANRLLAALPAFERSEFLACCALVELTPQALLVPAGMAPLQAWFPVDGLVSVSLPVRGSAEMAVAQAGCEGMFPVSLALGAAASPFAHRVQVAGRAFCIGREALAQHQQARVSLREVLQQHANACLGQLAQQAVCLNQHTVGQRLVRCLLRMRDRQHSRELFVTHDVLSRMLGVRRESVTQAAGALQRRGLLSYSRGYLMLLDEAALQGLACGCYAADVQASQAVRLGADQANAPGS